MNKDNANAHFPLFKYEFEEYVRGRDGGSSWADPENDIRKYAQINYYSKNSVDQDCWKLEYSENTGELAYASAQAVITLTNLRERYWFGREVDDYVMFEYHDKMFNITHVFDDQKCVCGRSADGQYFDDREQDDSIKVDFLQSYVSFYEKDDLVVKPYGIFINGKKYDHSDFPIDDFEFLKGHELAIIKEMIPQAKAVITWGGWQSLTNR